MPLYFARDRLSDLGVSYATDEWDDFGDAFPDVDPNYVEHFFEVNVDREIDQPEVCAYLPEDKIRRASLMREFDCPDLNNGKTLANSGDIYDSNITEPPEDCD